VGRHAMGLSVIAEGVEFEGQRDFLNVMGCHAFQGYLISPPLAIEDFERMVPGIPDVVFVPINALLSCQPSPTLEPLPTLLFQTR
jgi:predicted signal transduction protein with EAL and GGDEF domain